MLSPFKSFSSRAVEKGEMLPPPPQFIHYLPKGEIVHAEQCAEAPHGAPRPRKASKRAGLAYQRRVASWLSDFGFDGSVLVSPWFCYSDFSPGRHYCQPDLLLVAEDHVVVVEIKLSWTADAWWQLRKLYLPVLGKVEAFRGKKLIPLCICRGYDPAICIPDTVDLLAAFPKEFSRSALSVLVVK